MDTTAWQHEFVLASRERAVGRQLELMTEVRAGRLIRVARGVYRHATAVTTDRDRQPDDAYLARIRAAQLRSTAPLTFSGLSAAAVWELPIIGDWPERVMVATAPDTGGRSNTHLVRTYLGYPPPTVERGGLVVTSLARTVADVARTESMNRAVSMMDAALRGQPATQFRGARASITKAPVRRELRELGPVSGVVRARGVVDFADAKSGSAGESCSRVGMHTIGAPMPLLQHECYDDLGLIGVVDFWWPELRVVGEFDGRGKYLRDEYTRGRPIADIVMEEKAREDRLRAIGLRVVRWAWEVALDLAALERCLRRGGVC